MQYLKDSYGELFFDPISITLTIIDLDNFKKSPVKFKIIIKDIKMFF